MSISFAPWLVLGRPVLEEGQCTLTLGTTAATSDYTLPSAKGSIKNIGIAIWRQTNGLSSPASFSPQWPVSDV